MHHVFMTASALRINLEIVKLKVLHWYFIFIYARSANEIYKPHMIFTAVLHIEMRVIRSMIDCTEDCVITIIVLTMDVPHLMDTPDICCCCCCSFDLHKSSSNILILDISQFAVDNLFCLYCVYKMYMFCHTIFDAMHLAWATK